MNYADQLKQALGNRPFRYYEQIDSTNNLALEWIDQGAPYGALLIANEQLKGRGRLGRFWHTPPDVAIAMSLILNPQSNHFLSRIALLAGLVVVESLEQAYPALQPHLAIKWPNDVYLSGKKLCGILPEAKWSGDQLAGIVLGIGLNIRNELSPELSTIATTLESFTQTRVNRANLIQLICQRMDERLPYIESDQWMQAYKSREITLGNPVEAHLTQGHSMIGVAHDINQEGALMIKTDTEIITLMAGEVTLKRDHNGRD
ncbi:hypothetical protein MASR2M15_06330 [Anaerolineales bacterium]